MKRVTVTTARVGSYRRAEVVASSKTTAKRV